jgi:hypothetical protein
MSSVVSGAWHENDCRRPEGPGCKAVSVGGRATTLSGRCELESAITESDVALNMSGWIPKLIVNDSLITGFLVVTTEIVMIPYAALFSSTKMNPSPDLTIRSVSTLFYSRAMLIGP